MVELGEEVERQHNATLDGLRGVAAIAVVWYHETQATLARAVPARGYLSVDFFSF